MIQKTTYRMKTKSNQLGGNDTKHVKWDWELVVPLYDSMIANMIFLVIFLSKHDELEEKNGLLRNKFHPSKHSEMPLGTIRGC